MSADRLMVVHHSIILFGAAGDILRVHPVQQQCLHARPGSCTWRPESLEGRAAALHASGAASTLITPQIVCRSIRVVRAALALPWLGCSHVLPCNSRIHTQLGTTPAEVLRPHSHWLPFCLSAACHSGWPADLNKGALLPPRVGHLQALVGDALVPIEHDVQVQGARAVADPAALAPHGSLQGTGTMWCTQCLPCSLEDTTG